MAKGPIRGRSRPRRRAELGPGPGLVSTTNRGTVPLAPPLVPVAPSPVDPRALAERWARLETQALNVLEDGVTGQFEDPAHQRERRQAAECILGFRRGGLPMPAWASAIRSTTTSPVLRVRWADGRPVESTLHRPPAGPADAVRAPDRIAEDEEDE